MDLIEGRGAPSIRAHVDACARCRMRVEQVQEALVRAVQADVPEPLPVFWDSFRRQLDRRIDASAVPVGRRWRLVPVFAATMVVVSLLIAVPMSVRSPEPALPAWSALPPIEQDDGLLVLEALAPTVQETNSVGDYGGLAESLANLSDDEQLALTAVLRQEIKGEVM